MNRTTSAHRQALAIVGELEPKPIAVARRVLPLLVARSAENWHIFLAKEPGSGPDVVAVSPSGLFVVKFSECAPDEAVVDALISDVDRWSGRIRAGSGSQVVASSAVHEAVVVPQDAHVPGSPDRRVEIVRESRVSAWLGGKGSRFGRAQSRHIAEQMAGLLPGFTPLSVAPPLPRPAAEGLLDADDLHADQLQAAQDRPFEHWMTYRHPDQQRLVTRRYNGPARISGPAGTGKTVVALHRLRHLARRSTGPLLFTTFVRTLPTVHKAAFQRLAPEFADRVEFVHLHSWVGSFLEHRGIKVTVDANRAETAFSLAWAAHRDPLLRIEPNQQYWKTEVDRVIKGRGLHSFEQYRAIKREGRLVPLLTQQKRYVWDLFEAYQRNLEAKNLHDFNDLVDLALRELKNDPYDHRYAAVVVDEVQDITLAGLRLLHELAGDGPDGLLLVGDGQQQVYTGDWRLSEAGIPIQGRGAVLKVNYRNRAALLEHARRFDARNSVDDLDGSSGVTLRDVEVANPGGAVETWEGTRGALGIALTGAIKRMAAPRGALAVITFSRREVQRIAAILHRAGMPFILLDDYDGGSGGPIKLGTVHRAKGLDFQGVLVVDAQSEIPMSSSASKEHQRLRGRQGLVAATRARDHLWWGTVT